MSQSVSVFYQMNKIFTGNNVLKPTYPWKFGLGCNAKKTLSVIISLVYYQEPSL